MVFYLFNSVTFLSFYLSFSRITFHSSLYVIFLFLPLVFNAAKSRFLFALVLLFVTLTSFYLWFFLCHPPLTVLSFIKWQGTFIFSLYNFISLVFASFVMIVSWLLAHRRLQCERNFSIYRNIRCILTLHSKPTSIKRASTWHSRPKKRRCW